MQRASSLLYFLMLVFVTLACKGVGGGESAKPFKSPKNDFMVTFPPGSKEPVVKPDENMGDKDVTYLTANTDGTYHVRVLEWSRSPGSEPLKDFFVGGGVHFPLDDETKEIKFQNMRAVESRGWRVSDAVGGGSRQELRLLAVKDPNADRVYEIAMTTTKKESLSAKAADDFFNSFKLGAN